MLHMLYQLVNSHLLVVVASPPYLVVVDCDACDPSTAGGRDGPHWSTYSTTHIQTPQTRLETNDTATTGVFPGNRGEK